MDETIDATQDVDLIEAAPFISKEVIDWLRKVYPLTNYLSISREVDMFIQHGAQEVIALLEQANEYQQR